MPKWNALSRHLGLAEVIDISDHPRWRGECGVDHQHADIDTPRVWVPLRGRKKGNSIHVQLPPWDDDVATLRGLLRPNCRLSRKLIGVTWYMLVPRARRDELLLALVQRYGTVDVYQDFRNTTRCDMRCRAAEGDWCECSCLSANHGNGNLFHGEFVVGETTIISPGPITRTVRTLTAAVAATA